MAEKELINYGFLGIGQCGGNICNIAMSNGYTSMAINSSPEDLATLDLVRSKILLENGGGCGKNRDEGIDLVKSNYKKILSEVTEVFEKQKYIFVVFSTAGGTGSGVGPILADILHKKFKNKKIIIMAVLPTNSESLVALNNNIECLKEIYKLNLPTMLIDNQKFVEKNKNKSRDKLIDLINTYAISNLNLLFNSNLTMNSKYGTIDNKDLDRLFESPGMIVISKNNFTSNEYNEVGIEQIILNSIDRNIYSKISKNKVIDRMGIIYEVPKELMTTSDYNMIKAELGQPVEIFEGFRELSVDINNKNKVIVILSGLSFPKERIQEYSKIINEISAKVNTEEEDIFEEINIKNDIFKNRKSKKKAIIEEDTSDEVDLDDLFSKY